MCGNNGSHITHAAVTAFYIVLIEELMVPMADGEMFSHYLQELFADVGGYILVERWVKPYDVPAPLSLASSCMCSGRWGHSRFMTALLQGCSVRWYRLTKLVLIAG